MANLVSPGVSISVLDQSITVGANPGTVPLIFIATAENKPDPTTTGSTAIGTLKANAGTVYSITSQRDLISTFGSPTFYNISGNQINGYPLNEYGLLAAYSYLGTSNLAQVVRADIDLNALQPTPIEPTSPAAIGTYWLNQSSAGSVYGLFKRSGTFPNEVWDNITPNFNYDFAAGTGITNVPTPTDGVAGNIATVFQTDDGTLSFWYKNNSSTWIQMGTRDLNVSGTGSSAIAYISNAGATSTGTTITVNSTTGLLPGMIPTISTGVGTFAANTVIDTIVSSTQFTVNVAPTVALSGGSTVVQAGAVITFSNTANVYTGMVVNVTTGTGAFANNTTVLAVSPTTFTVNQIPSTPLIGAVNIAGFYNLSISSVWPDLTSPATTQEYWLKTTSAAQGANILLQIMDATTNAFINVGAPILTNDAAANSFYADEPNGPAGQIYIEPVISGSNPGSLTNSLEFRYSPDSTGSNWAPLETIVGSSTIPTSGPINGQLWFNSLVGLDSNGGSVVDILVNDGQDHWENINLPGFALPGSTNNPTLYPQSQDPRSNTPVPTLKNGDIWLQTDASPYPVLFRWSGATWVSVNLSDQSSPNGIIFDDARPNPAYHKSAYTGQNNAGGNYPDLDPDAPQAALYPRGLLLWNTRFSTMNVKTWQSPYVFDGVTAGADDTNNGSTGRWVDVSGSNASGTPYMGSDAQHIVAANAINAIVVNNDAIRADDLYLNLIAAPGFIEATPNLLGLNDDRGDTAFVLVDSPMTLNASGTTLQAWATNANNALTDGNDGLISASKYFAVWYPSALTTNTDGTSVVAPSTHMALSTLAYNDQVAYPWFAPAGLTRGIVNNASSVGWVNSSGQYVPTQLSQGQRDILYQNNINPIRTMPNGGVVVYGQKTRQSFSSAEDRINVVRLENYLRYTFNNLAQPFLFEPNDALTRAAVKAAFDSALSELVTLRGIYDFLTVCDLSNNTPATIDANELWVNVAISPERDVEFIFIPISIVNYGALTTG